MFLTIDGDTTRHNNMTHGFVYMYSIDKDPKCFLHNTLFIHASMKNNIKDRKQQKRIKRAIKEAKNMIKGKK